MKNSKQMHEIDDVLPARSIQSRLAKAVEMEVYSWTDVAPDLPRHPLVVDIDRRLMKCVAQFEASQQIGDRDGALARPIALKRELVRVINAISLELIRDALESYETVRACNEIVMVNRGGQGEKEIWEEANLEDIVVPSIGLKPIEKIRNFSPADQLNLLRYLQNRTQTQESELLQNVELGNDEMRMFFGNGPKTSLDRIFSLQRDKAMLESERIELGKKIKSDLIECGVSFHDYVRIRTIHPHSLPIAVGASFEIDDLRLVGNAFKEFGALISFGSDSRIVGEVVSAQVAAEDALLFREAARSAFTVLGAWIISLSLIHSHRRCDICCRYAGTRHRCTEHSTDRHKTQATRLGQRVSPGYQMRLTSLISNAGVRKVLRAQLGWNAEPASDIDAAGLRSFNLSHDRSVRAMVLWNQIVELSPLLNDDMKKKLEGLFVDILLHVVEVDRITKGYKRANHNKAYDSMLDTAVELLTMKGFFRAWCGNGDYSTFVRLNMKNVDSRNPICKGSGFDEAHMRLTLLSQRTWEEEESQFVKVHMPTAADLKEAMKKMPIKAAAAMLGIGLSTAYKIVGNKKNQRKRNHLGTANQ